MLISDLRYNFTVKILNGHDSLWCDREDTETNIETCDELIRIAFSNALMELRKKYGNSMEDWKWGRIHKQHFLHIPFDNMAYAKGIPVKDMGLLNRLFFREINSHGSGSTVNVAPISYNNNLYMISTGQSGNIASSHYDDLIENARAGNYINMPNEMHGGSNQLILNSVSN